MEACLNRSRVWLRIAALWICCAGALSPAAARASVAIGQLPPGPPAPNCTVSDVDYLQPSVTGGNLYVARQAGRITSWTTDSSGPGAVYVLKVFRRTSDPESFRVVARSAPRTLTSGLNVVSVDLPVKSGDLLGYHESGPPNSCTFSQPGDTVLTRDGDLADGTAGTFAPQNDFRLNLSAVLIPDNAFTISPIARDRKRGIATMTVTTSNPGLVTVGGKGMKKRPAKSRAVAGPVTFGVVAVGNAKRRLARRGRTVLPVHVTFFPTGGDPATQSVNVKLKTKRLPPPISPP